MIAASLTFLAAGMLTATAQSMAEYGHSATTTLPVKGTTESTDGNFNFKSFEVEAPQAGEYYTEFWLQPARYANDQYTTFMVYVNNEYVGDITPSVGNWQSARVNDNETINLIK